MATCLRFTQPQIPWPRGLPLPSVPSPPSIRTPTIPHGPPHRRDQITEIVRLRSQRLISRMAEKRMALELQDSAVEFLASVG